MPVIYNKLKKGIKEKNKQELKKVVWPTKQETTQTALGVIAIVVIIGLILWLIDMFFGWSIGTLYGVN